MEHANGKPPQAAPEKASPQNNTPISLAAIADGLTQHILQIAKGDMAVAASIANLLKIRMDTEYKFLLEQSLNATLAAMKRQAQPSENKNAN